MPYTHTKKPGPYTSNRDPYTDRYTIHMTILFALCTCIYSLLHTVVISQVITAWWLLVCVFAHTLVIIITPVLPQYYTWLYVHNHILCLCLLTSCKDITGFSKFTMCIVKLLLWAPVKPCLCFVKLPGATVYIIMWSDSVRSCCWQGCGVVSWLTPLLCLTNCWSGLCYG